MKYLPIYFDNAELIQSMSYAQSGKVLNALLDYATTGVTDVPLSNVGQVVYRKIRAEYDRSRSSYDEKCSNMSKAAQKREQSKRENSQQSTIVHNCGEDKDKEKDKDKDNTKNKENAAQSAYWRAGARERREDMDFRPGRQPRRSGRILKNNSECTYRKEDLFIPFWVVEGEEEPDTPTGASG